MFEKVIIIAFQYGLPTVLLFIVGWAYDRKETKCGERERELAKQLVEEQASTLKESQARVEDAKAYHEISRKLQSDLIATAQKLSDINDARNLQRELIEAIGKLDTIAEAVNQRNRGRG